MDRRPTGEEERATLKRIVALLLALTDLAARAGTRSPAVRVFVLWLLLPAEAVARNLVTDAPAPCPFHHAGLSRTDAMRLARRLRNLASEVDRQAASAVCTGDIGPIEPAWAGLCRTLQRAGSPGLVGRSVFTAPGWAFPDGGQSRKRPWRLWARNWFDLSVGDNPLNFRDRKQQMI